MQAITVKGRTLELDGNGFLAHPDEWNQDVADYFAGVEGIQMTDQHWAVVHFLRDYYRQYSVAPMVKVLVKELGGKLGSEKVNTRYLATLYPCGLATQACKIAGLPESTGCA